MDSDLDQVGERIAEQAAHLDAATHRLLTDLRDFDERGGWHKQGALSCAHWLSWRVGWSLVVARERVRVAHKLAVLPTIDDALRRGEVSYSKVRAMVRVATPQNEELLLEHARLMTASRLENTCRKYALVQRHEQDPHPLADLQRRYVRRRDTEDGMVKIEAVLHPDEAELVWTMLNHATARLTRDPDSAHDDSAESRGPGAPSQDASTLALGSVTNRESDDSAESRRGGAPSQDTSTLVMGSVVNRGERRFRGVAGGRGTEPGHVENGTGGCGESGEGRFRGVAAGRGTEEGHIDVGDGVGGEPGERRFGGVAGAPGSEPGHINVGDGVGGEPGEQRFRGVAAGRGSEPGHIDVGDGVGGEPGERRFRGVAAGRGTEEGRVDVGDGVGGESGERRSAESRRAGAPSQDASTLVMGSVANRESDDSAESRRPRAPSKVTSMSAPVRTTCDDRNDAEELQRLVAPANVAPALISTSAADRKTDEFADAWKPSSQREGWSASGGVAATGVLDRRMEAARRGFNRADGLVSIAQGYLRGDRPNRSPIEIALTIPAIGLRRGAVDMADPVECGQIGESFVSAEAARRLACDAGLVKVVEDEHGSPLSVGRKQRTIAGSLKRALLQRDKTCTFPGCSNRLFLEGHHIQHWADGGETSLANACLLCTQHHHYVHEYGYTIELCPDQRPQFRDQHGQLVPTSPDRPQAPDLGLGRIRAQNEHLAITSETPACEWDGRNVDYGTVIGHLLRADGLL